MPEKSGTLGGSIVVSERQGKMPGPKRERRKRTEEWASIKQWTLWPEQELYEQIRPLTFLRVLFVFLSYNFSRGFPQSAWKGAPLMNVAVSFSRITFPCRVCHFVFGKRRCLTVFSHRTFRFRLANITTGVQIYPYPSRDNMSKEHGAAFPTFQLGKLGEYSDANTDLRPPCPNIHPKNVWVNIRTNFQDQTYFWR